jgi:hypothetical protein
VSPADEVPISHPWLGSAELHWANKEGSKLKEVFLRSPGHGEKLEHQDELIACATSGLGAEAKVNSTDYLEKKKDVSVTPREGGEVRVYSHMIAVTVRDSPFSKPMPKATWEKTMRVLDACGRN